MPHRGRSSMNARRAATAPASARVSGLAVTTNGALVSAMPRLAFGARPSGRTFAISFAPGGSGPSGSPGRLATTTSSSTCGASAARHSSSSVPAPCETTTVETVGSVLTAPPRLLEKTGNCEELPGWLAREKLLNAHRDVISAARSGCRRSQRPPWPNPEVSLERLPRHLGDCRATSFSLVAEPSVELVAHPDCRALHAASIDSQQLAVHLECPPRRFAPRVRPRTLQSGRPQALPVSDRPLDSAGEGNGIAWIDEDRCVACDLGDGARRGRHNRRAGGHRFEHGQAETLVAGGKDETGGAAIQGGELLPGDMAADLHAGLESEPRDGPPELGAPTPVRARDDEPEARVRQRDRLECG